MKSRWFALVVNGDVTPFCRNRRSTVRQATFAGIGSFLGLWGDVFFSVAHIPPWIPLSLLSFGGIFLAYAARQIRVNAGGTDTSSNLYFRAIALAVMTLTLLGAALSHGNKIGVRPHFRLLLNTADFPDAGLELINMRPVDEGITMSVAQFVILPTDSTQSNFVFRFSISNDSPANVESPEIGIMLPQSWTCSTGPDWVVARNRTMVTNTLPNRFGRNKPSAMPCLA